MVLLLMFGLIKIGKISQFNLYRLSALSRSRNAIDTRFKKVGPMMAVNTLARGKKQSVPTVMLDKYVGEMDTDELAETVMDKSARTLKQITVEDGAAAAKVFMNLMGESVDPRKKFIEANAWRANVDV